MHTQFFVAVLGGLAIGPALFQMSVPQPVQLQEAKGAKKSAASDLEGLNATAAAFEKEYNAGDAKAIAAQFTENAEIVDEDGNVIEGRANIEARFAELLKTHPKARIAVELTSLKQLSPDVAVEDGYSMTTLNLDEPGSRSPYALVM